MCMVQCLSTGCLCSCSECIELNDMHCGRLFVCAVVVSALKHTLWFVGAVVVSALNWTLWLVVCLCSCSECIEVDIHCGLFGAV